MFKYIVECTFMIPFSRYKNLNFKKSKYKVWLCRFLLQLSEFYNSIRAVCVLVQIANNLAKLFTTNILIYIIHINEDGNHLFLRIA